MVKSTSFLSVNFRSESNPMHDFLSILKRFIPPYKLRLAKSILFNLLHAIFGTLSVTMLIPILDILFATEPTITEKVAFSFENMKDYFYYYITQIKTEYGAGSTLLFIGLIAIFGTALKTGFAYLAAYETIFIRNGVVRDIRQKLFMKILTLPLPFFSEERKGDIISRMTGDVQEVEASIMSSLEMLFQRPVLILVYLVSMLIMLCPGRFEESADYDSG